MEPYHNSFEHLRHEIQRLDLMLRRALLAARHPAATDQPQEYRGLVISESEIDDMLENTDFMGARWRREGALQDSLRPIDDKLAEMRTAIDARRAGSEESTPRLNLAFLAQQFGLSQAEVDLLLIALAPELEPSYETLYAYLQDDVTRKHPSVDLSLNLICRAEKEKLFARRLLSAEAPLTHYQLIHLEDEPQDRQALFSRKYLKIAAPVLHFLLDEPSEAAATARLTVPQPGPAESELSDNTLAALHGAIESILRSERRQNVIRLVGHDPISLNAACQVLAAAFNRHVLSFQLSHTQNAASALPSAICEATLFDGMLAISVPELLPGEASGRTSAFEHQLWRELARMQDPVALLGPPGALESAPAEASDVLVWSIEVASPDFARRRESWSQSLAAAGASADADTLADRFHLGGLRIRQAVNLALTNAAQRDPSNPTPAQADFIGAGRALSTPNLSRFAVAIAPRYTWADIVLPVDKMAQLHAIGARVRCHRRVLEEWGFGEKLSRGKGNMALFSGPPGTGKTMAAEAMANELGFNLFQIDLSTVVSKYIGETESNLSAIFREAENTSTLLFFDEADALFGKRTEVKDAHDRYANQEVNYLLQRVEQYEGVVILATNFQKNMDEAFLRRLQFVVDFPMPGPSQREQIWRSQFPTGAPVDSSVDLGFLAHQFKISGGSIRNIVLAAAFAAAEEGVSISMRHLATALRTETLKEGKLLMKNELGPYLDLFYPAGESVPPLGEVRA